MRNTRAGVALAAAVTAIAASPAAGQERPGYRGFVSVGAAFVPDYLGADEYRAIPLVSAEIPTRIATFSLRGLSARADFLGPRSSGKLRGGIELRYRFARSGAADPRVAALPAVGSALELGGFLGYRFAGVVSPRDALTVSISAGADVTGSHGGIVATPAVSYAFPIGRRVRADISAAASFGDDAFARTYFGVTPAGAAASGLPAFSARGGLHAIGISGGVTVPVSRRWGIGLRAGYRRMVGDAARSPIIGVAGSADQIFGGVSVSYRF